MTVDHSVRIKEEAKRLGFSHVGISPAVALTEEGEHLREWLSRGYQAGMGWMDRLPERRIDPRLVLEGARSVVSVAMNYFVPGERPASKNAGKISRYAWGDDYHDVVGNRLRELETFIKSLEEHVGSRRYVDTGPVMDKAWAARGGIGWLGKHTNVLTRSHGSWVFLGTILTTLECPYDQPETDMCGTCTACLDACPTDAFPEPYVLDAAKCISYLTIEHRGEIPAALGKSLDGWIFGCDICQDVCPWNRFAQPTTEGSFHPRMGLVEPDLEQLSDLEPKEFSERFRGSAIKRAKVEGLKRNIRHVIESSA